MLRSYGLYKKVRDAAWQILIENKIDSLPVNISKIAGNNGIALKKNSDVNELKKGEAGISIFDTDTCYIVYDDTIPSVEKRRFVLAHELAHIFSGHPLAGAYPPTIDTKDGRVEREADSFAVRLLSPACVLWGLNLQTADEIAEICKLEIETARKRAARMKILYERQKFLTSPLEKKLFDQFKEYIEKSKNKNSPSVKD